jgi:hypothetical protein
MVKMSNLMGGLIDLDITPEMILKFKELFRALKTVKKAEVDTEKYTIKAYSETQPNRPGKRVICIRIEEG